MNEKIVKKQIKPVQIPPELRPLIVSQKIEKEVEVKRKQ